MRDREAFLSAILAHPDDDLPRLVFADWLDEHGDPARAEFIRLQCELARLPARARRRTALERREAELLETHKTGWTEGAFLGWLDHAATLLEGGTRWQTPGDLAAAINPATVQTPALDLVDEAVVDTMNTPDGRLIITMGPQEGKSTRVAQDTPKQRVVLGDHDLDAVAHECWDYARSGLDRPGAEWRYIRSTSPVALRTAPAGCSSRLRASA